MSADQRCGTCTFYEHWNQTGGVCTAPVPEWVESQWDRFPGDGGTRGDKGTTCSCWEAKE